MPVSSSNIQQYVFRTMIEAEVLALLLDGDADDIDIHTDGSVKLTSDVATRSITFNVVDIPVRKQELEVIIKFITAIKCSGNPDDKMAILLTTDMAVADAYFKIDLKTLTTIDVSFYDGDDTTVLEENVALGASLSDGVAIEAQILLSVDESTSKYTSVIVLSCNGSVIFVSDPVDSFNAFANYNIKAKYQNVNSGFFMYIYSHRLYAGV